MAPFTFLFAALFVSSIFAAAPRPTSVTYLDTDGKPIVSVSVEYSGGKPVCRIRYRDDERVGGGCGHVVARIAEIRAKIQLAEQRIADLEALLTEYILETVPLSSADEDAVIEANQVRQELYRTRAYEGELRTDENYWNQIVESNKQAQKDTQVLMKAP